MLVVVMWCVREKGRCVVEGYCNDFQCRCRCNHVEVESEFGRCDAGCAGTMQVR